MRILVDADACPVKKIIIQVGKEFHIPVILVSSISHFSTKEEEVERIIVDNAAEAVDIAIANHINKGDIVVTQDYGLASIVIAKGGIAIHHHSFIYSEDNMDELLFKRHLHAKIRRSGGKHKGPKAFGEKEKVLFRHFLVNVISNHLGSNLK